MKKTCTSITNKIEFWYSGSQGSTKRENCVNNVPKEHPVFIGNIDSPKSRPRDYIKRRVNTYGSYEGVRR